MLHKDRDHIFNIRTFNDKTFWSHRVSGPTRSSLGLDESYVSASPWSVRIAAVPLKKYIKKIYSCSTRSRSSPRRKTCSHDPCAYTQAFHDCICLASLNTGQGMFFGQTTHVHLDLCLRLKQCLGSQLILKKGCFIETGTIS